MSHYLVAVICCAWGADIVVCAVDEMLVLMLDSGKRDVVFTACGVLINIMADEEKRAVLKRDGGIKK